MGKPLMIQKEDDDRIEKLKKRIGAKTKVQVVRSALELLEEKTSRAERATRWRRAAVLVSGSSREVLQEFQKHSRLKRSDSK